MYSSDFLINEVVPMVREDRYIMDKNMIIIHNFCEGERRVEYSSIVSNLSSILKIEGSFMAPFSIAFDHRLF